MAKLNYHVDASFSQLAELTDDEKWQIIEPAAELARAAYAAAADAVFKRHTGALAESPTVERKTNKHGVFARIGLKGKHPNSSTGIRYKKDRNGKRRKSGNYSGTNAEVGYFLNYGTPRIKATHWFDNASDKVEAEVQQKLEDGWNAYLDSKGV